MKKGLFLIMIVVIAVAVYFLFFYKSGNDKPAEVHQKPLAISKNSDSFNVPFDNMLQTYYSLKNALVNWDTVKVDEEASNLASAAAKIPYEDLKADTTVILTAKSFSDNVVNESKALVSKSNIEDKRRSFNTISDALYNLVRTVQYDRDVVYHMTCPMAFNDSEPGFWLSDTNKIINPYLGNKHPKYHTAMLGCGNVLDSIDFTRE
ncbi:MAG: DUF3347 domain-containing protein [Ilyomonas sp.]